MDSEALSKLVRVGSETRNVDFKLTLNWVTSSKTERVEVVRDILAMANTEDGGSLVYGVRDEDHEFVGMPDQDQESFDTTKVNDLVHKYADPKFSCTVYKGQLDGKRVVVVQVPEFAELPIICKLEFADPVTHDLILRKGGVYIRTDKATSELVSAHEMKDLLRRALLKRRHELVKDIQRIVAGPLESGVGPSEELYEAEIKQAKDFLYPTVGSKTIQFGTWELAAYPARYLPDRVDGPGAVRDLVRKSEVSLRGWNFPHMDREAASFFNKGHQSITSWDAYIEGYRAYQSGLFFYQGVFDTDVRGKTAEGKRALEFVDAIWTITEFFLFLSRYCENMVVADDIKVQLTLSGTANRMLTTFHPGLDVRGYVARESAIAIETVVSDVELKADWQAIAQRYIRRVFLMFGWENASETMIGNWQRKLIERRF